MKNGGLPLCVPISLQATKSSRALEAEVKVQRRLSTWQEKKTEGAASFWSLLSEWREVRATNRNKGNLKFQGEMREKFLTQRIRREISGKGTCPQASERGTPQRSEKIHHVSYQERRHLGKVEAHLRDVKSW